MEYYKWLSDNNEYMIEKFVGDVSSDFIELADKHVVSSFNQDGINVISDVRHATFRSVELNQVWDLSRNLHLHTHPKLKIKYAVVFDAENIEDQDKINRYVERLDLFKNINAKSYNLMSDAYDWLNVPLSISEKMERKLQEWETPMTHNE